MQNHLDEFINEQTPNDHETSMTDKDDVDLTHATPRQWIEAWERDYKLKTKRAELQAWTDRHRKPEEGYYYDTLPFSLIEKGVHILLSHPPFVDGFRREAKFQKQADALRERRVNQEDIEKLSKKYWIPAWMNQVSHFISWFFFKNNYFGYFLHETYVNYLAKEIIVNGINEDISSMKNLILSRTYKMINDPLIDFNN